MKSKELKTYNLPSERLVNSSINAKPIGLFIFLIAAGLIMTFIQKTQVIGVMMWMGASVFMMFLPSRVLAEFSDDYVVLYNRADRNDCVLVYYEDVVSWKYDRGVTEDELTINLEDGTSTRIEAFSKTLFESRFNQYLREKKEKSSKS